MILSSFALPNLPKVVPLAALYKLQRQASALLVGDTGEVGGSAKKLVALAAQHKIR